MPNKDLCISFAINSDFTVFWHLFQMKFYYSSQKHHHCHLNCSLYHWHCHLYMVVYYILIQHTFPNACFRTDCQSKTALCAYVHVKYAFIKKLTVYMAFHRGTLVLRFYTTSFYVLPSGNFTSNYLVANITNNRFYMVAF